MKVKILPLFILLITMTIFPSFSFAHPGRTASDGCHYCRTNCDSWGVPWNERHCHGGGTVQGVQESAPAYNPPTDRPAPTTIPYIPPPTKAPLIFPTVTMVPTNTTSPIPTITETPIPKPTKIVVNKVNGTKKLKKQITKKKTFWQWLFRK